MICVCDKSNFGEKGAILAHRSKVQSIMWLEVGRQEAKVTGVGKGAEIADHIAPILCQQTTVCVPA